MPFLSFQKWVVMKMRQHVIKMKSELAACWLDIVVMLAAPTQRRKKKCSKVAQRACCRLDGAWNKPKAKEVKWERTEGRKTLGKVSDWSREMQMKEGRSCCGLADTTLWTAEWSNPQQSVVIGLRWKLCGWEWSTPLVLILGSPPQFAEENWGNLYLHV